MSLYSCCKQLLHRFSDSHRAVICKSWIRPLRILAIGSLFAHLLWRAYHPALFYTFLIIIIHSAIALIILNECKRSERFHKTIAEFERREAIMRDNPRDK